MKTLILSVLALVVVTASAQAARGPVTVDRLTCGQAQAVVAKYHTYWKNVGADGAVRIYPVAPRETLLCKGRESAAPVVESTRDNSQCVVGWYCRAPI